MNFPFDCILLDLDDTLYPGSTGIGQAVKRNIDELLAVKCGVSAEKASSLRVELFKMYGSSLAGLIALGYDVHPDEYHSYVHGRLPYDRIEADLQLAELLQSIPQRKILFLDDSERNISAGKAVGLRTALVAKKVKTKEADYVLEHIGGLRRAIPEIWGAAAMDVGPSENMEKKGTRSDLYAIIPPTSVKA